MDILKYFPNINEESGKLCQFILETDLTALVYSYCLLSGIFSVSACVYVKHK